MDYIGIARKDKCARRVWVDCWKIVVELKTNCFCNTRLFIVSCVRVTVDGREVQEEGTGGSFI